MEIIITGLDEMFKRADAIFELNDEGIFNEDEAKEELINCKKCLLMKLPKN
jgi:hypothetical protein